MSDEPLRVTAYTEYHWECPVCEETNVEDDDPTGDELDCNNCGEEVLIEKSV